MRHLALGLALTAACAAPPSPRQDPPPASQQPAAQQPAAQQPSGQQPPVVVTARKLEERAQDVPQSVTALPGSQLQEAGATMVKDASYYVPNTLVTEFSARRLSLPYVRGVGSGQGEPAVATFYDGVPQLGVNSTNLPFVGVERVEFLRGPLGALYGRNTIGGAIHVLSESPPAQRTGTASVGFGDFGWQEYLMSFKTPVTEDRLFLGGDVRHTQRDGYTKNDFTGNDVDSRDDWFGRGQALWAPDEENDVRFVVHGERARDGGFVLSELNGLRARPHHINQDFEGDVDRDVAAGTVTWNHRGTGSVLTSITSLTGSDIDETADFDFSPIDGVRRFTDENQTWLYQEVRLASPQRDGPAKGETRVNWLAGLSGFLSDATQSATNEYRPAGAGILFPPSQVGTDRAEGDLDGWALGLFGQASVLFGSDFELTGALRYDVEAKDADIDRTFTTPTNIVVPLAATDDSETWDELLPRVSGTWHATEDVMAYALAARGFKAGGYNLTAPTGSERFGPETSWTYEAGAKTSFLEDKVTANLSVFWIDWEDMQLSQFDAQAGGYVTNAGESQSRGIELELAGRPCGGLQLFGSAGLLSTEFDRFTDSFGQDTSGNDLPFAPETTGSIGAHWSVEVSQGMTAFVRGEYFHVGEFFYDAGNRASDRYGLANFRAGLGGSRWRVEAWVRNAFDAEYVPVAFQPSPVDPTLFVGESGAPRTFGVVLTLTL
jgi:iron complex outermembrane receptor protein